MVRTANIKLMMAEDQKRSAVEKLKEAEEERAMAEAAKKEALERADAWWENLQGISKEKQKLESDKRTLENAMVAVERDKDRLENEKLEWTKIQSLMELEKSQLQKDIEKAREEARGLETSAEKWQRTLQTTKRAAEEREAHLREIQHVLQAHQVPGFLPSAPPDAARGSSSPSASSLQIAHASSQQSPLLPLGPSSEHGPPLGTTATQDPGGAFSQLLTILARALNQPQQGMERQMSIETLRSRP